MPQGLFGLVAALAFTALLGYQAARAPRGSRLRQAYGLAAAGFGIIIALNGLYLFGAGNPTLASTVSLSAVALLIGAVAALGAAIFNGEFQAKIRQAQEYTAGERERLARQRAERERGAAAPPDGGKGGDTGNRP